MSDFSQAVEVILRHEGGLVDNPADPGGVTNFGISIRFAQREINPAIDAEWIRKLDRATAATIYRTHWWERYSYGEIRDQVAATKVFDVSVNTGPHQAHLLAQRTCIALGQELTLDGVLGPASIGAINACDPDAWVHEMCIRQSQFYLELIDAKPHLGVFEAQWLKRAAWPTPQH